MLDEKDLQAITAILEEVTRENIRRYEPTGVLGSMKLCYVAIGSIKDQVEAASCHPERIALPDLAVSLAQRENESLRLWVDDQGIASSVYRTLVNRISRLARSS